MWIMKKLDNLMWSHIMFAYEGSWMQVSYIAFHVYLATLATVPSTIIGTPSEYEQEGTYYCCVLPIVDKKVLLYELISSQQIDTIVLLKVLKEWVAIIIIKKIAPPENFFRSRHWVQVQPLPACPSLNIVCVGGNTPYCC